MNRSIVGLMRAALTGVVKIVTDALCSARRRAMSVAGIKWPEANHGSIKKCGIWGLDLERKLLLISIIYQKFFVGLFGF